ncbi:MAG: fused MFS/spermidine synthase [Planctomycetota bacterium]|jgi:spermidine synthase
MVKKALASSEAVLRGSASGIMTLILVCFFFSGLTGLIYEILWTRMIVKVIGGAPFAVSIILTVFMAGLGLGSYIASRTIDRIKEPLRLVRIYGILELAIGGYGLVLPWLLAAFLPLYAMLYNRLFAHFMVYNFLTFVGCCLLLLVPVICMGATLPVLCRFYVTRLSYLGTHAGRLYGLNTIGAAAGALVCGFWLINLLGVPGTLALAVALNGIIGLVCIVVSYRIKTDVVRVGKAATTSEKNAAGLLEQPAYKGAAVGALVIFAVSGFCAMAYEVIWTKLLGLIIGPTTYSFTIVLVTFIACLALGSMIFGWLADRMKRPMRLLVYTQIMAALFALLFSQVLGNSQFFFAKLIYHFQDNFALLNMLKAGILFCFMLLPTICLGATFPLVGKICTRSLEQVGRSLGFAYAINTIGAVLGSFCAGFVLVPLIGKENGLRLVVVIQLFTALVIAAHILWFSKQGWLRWVPAGVLAVVGLFLCLHFPSWNRTSLCMGRYHRLKGIGGDIERSRWLDALWRGSDILAKQKIGEVVYYGDGIGGFCVVLQSVDIFGRTDYMLLISGKADASSYGDMPTQTLTAHFPMIFHPNPKTVMVLGHASGITAGETLCYPIKRLDVLEISPEVVVASKFFEPWNNYVLSNPKTELIVQDGRAHLQLTNRKYDVIISEPSNPWMAGLAALFTHEFFELARDQLNDEGIFAQFIHSYQMDWPTFALVGRTFADVFGNSILVSTAPGDYLMIGFKGGKGLVLDNARRNLRFAQQSKNMTLLDARLLYRLVITEDLHGLCGQGPINTDNWPRLEFAAPKAMFVDDPVIAAKITAGRRLRPEIEKIVSEISADVDAQIDFAELAFSMHYVSVGLVNFYQATPAQRERFSRLVETYCAKHEIDYSVIKDVQLKRRCRFIQIEAIKNKLNVLTDRSLAYYTLADLYRENGILTEAERYYSEALRLRPNHAELHNDLGVVFHMQGKLAEAIVHYNEALRLKADYPGARQNREKALAQLREQASGNKQ